MGDAIKSTRVKRKKESTQHEALSTKNEELSTRTKHAARSTKHAARATQHLIRRPAKVDSFESVEPLCQLFNLGGLAPGL